MNFHVNFAQHRRRSAIYIYGFFMFEIFITILTTVIFHFNHLSWETAFKIFFATSCYVLSNYMILGVVFQFVCGVIALRDRFNLITYRMSIKYRLSSFEILNYVELYKKLIKIALLIQRHLTMQLLPVFFFSFVNLNFGLYSIARSFVSVNGSKEGKLQIIADSIWIFVFIFPMVAVVQASESTQEAFEDVKNVGYEILSTQRVLNTEPKEAFTYFLKLMKLSKLRMQTIFFDLDWKLIFKVS